MTHLIQTICNKTHYVRKVVIKCGLSSYSVLSEQNMVNHRGQK